MSRTDAILGRIFDALDETREAAGGIVSGSIFATVYLSRRFDGFDGALVVGIAMLLVVAYVGFMAYTDGLTEGDEAFDRAVDMKCGRIMLDTCSSEKARAINRAMERMHDDCELICKAEGAAPMQS